MLCAVTKFPQYLVCFSDSSVIFVAEIENIILCPLVHLSRKQFWRTHVSPGKNAQNMEFNQATVNRCINKTRYRRIKNETKMKL